LTGLRAVPTDSKQIAWPGLVKHWHGWSSLPTIVRADIPGLQRMSWTRVGWLFLVTLGFTVFSLSGQIIRAGEWPWMHGHDLGLDSVNWFFHYLFYFGPVLITLTLADNLPFTGAKRTAALVVALLIGVQFQWPLICTYVPSGDTSCDDFPRFLWRSWTEMLGENTVFAVMDAAPIALTYFYRRRDRRAAKALHEAEVARTDLQRRTLEAQLHTMQARVEPSFLFDTLGDIGELYDREPAAGERILNELIDYLRAALPDTSTAGSTLRQEAALARAYLAILRIRAHGRLAADVRIPESLDGARIPPVMIVPLLAAGIGPAPAIAAGCSIQLAAIDDGAVLRLVITGRGTSMRALDDAQVVDETRERLRTLYGENASLQVHAEPGRRLAIVLELPRIDD
jgi:hypothetical protein